MLEHSGIKNIFDKILLYILAPPMFLNIINIIKTFPILNIIYKSPCIFTTFTCKVTFKGRSKHVMSKITQTIIILFILFLAVVEFIRNQ